MTAILTGAMQVTVFMIKIRVLARFHRPPFSVTVQLLLRRYGAIGAERPPNGIGIGSAISRRVAPSAFLARFTPQPHCRRAQGARPNQNGATPTVLVVSSRSDSSTTLRPTTAIECAPRAL